MNDFVTWEEPPPAARRYVRAHDVIPLLAQHPNRWARIKTVTRSERARSSALHMRRGEAAWNLARHGLKGRLEVVPAPAPDGRGHNIYARYIPHRDELRERKQ